MTEPADKPVPSDRYIRQMRYPPLGEEGQQQLANSSVLLCGCGALGSVLANTLVRAGVGSLRIIDRDFLELNNLQRQVLYDEADVAAGLPKAIAAQQKLQRINSEVEIDAVVTDLNSHNVIEHASGVDLLLDGTDNFETRFLLNDTAHKLRLPWVYGGCIGAGGQTLTILPGETPCLRCLMADVPPPGTTPTCDTAGILGPIVNVIASIQAAEAIKILSGNRQAICRTLNIIELWDNRLRQVGVEGLRAAGGCPTCREESPEYPWLEGDKGSHSAILCGRNAVQLSFPERAMLSLEELEQRLEGVGRIERNLFLLRLHVGEYVLTVFPDGRAIIAGTEEIAQAKSLYARYIGS